MAPVVVEIASDFLQDSRTNKEVMRARTAEAIHMSQVLEMHEAYQSRPSLLTHASNPIFQSPSFDAFLRATSLKTEQRDPSFEPVAESEDVDGAFVQALDLNSTNDTDMLDDDVDGLRSAATARQRILEIKNEEFQ